MVNVGEGNILKADAEALVNTVNCVGLMGKGIALQFKQAYPGNFKAYEQACRSHEVQPGRMFVYSTGSMINPRYIINFPTKTHWKGKSRLEYISKGLPALTGEVKRLGIMSIAVPPLGCGLGGLDWYEVRPLIERAFEALPDVRVLLYEPHGTPDAKTMPVRTERPKLTVARALYIKLMQQYAGLAYRLTLLEMQKLAYFLQESGEDLRLRYEKGIYGPYAHNLNKVLEVLEGHYIRGYGANQKADTDIELLPYSAEDADNFLALRQMPLACLKRVGQVIDGFETPYGMELLASVHWVAVHSEEPAEDADSAIALVHAWNDRKRAMFKPEHIRIAWNRLSEKGWLSRPVAVAE